MEAEGSRDKKLEINVRDDNKLVEVWMTNVEQQDHALREKLKPLYQEYKRKKYLVAVFLSGANDLEQRTCDLLCYNKKRIAELAVQRERTQIQDMTM